MVKDEKFSYEIKSVVCDSLRVIQSDAKELILKAQIHAGGRGKGHFDTGFKGGVKILSNSKEVTSVNL